MDAPWLSAYLNWLPGLILMTGRVSGLFLTAPLLSSKILPLRIKLFLVLGISWCLFAVRYPGPELPSSPLEYACFWLADLAFGAALGFLATTLVAGIQTAFQLLDVQAGFGVAGAINPGMDWNGAVLAQTSYVFALLVLLSVNGHHQLLLAIARSYDVVPAGHFPFAGASWGVMLDSTRLMFRIAVSVGAPLVAVLMLADLCFGLLARTVPQMNIFIAAFPVKIALALVSLALAAPDLVPFMARIFGHIAPYCERFLVMLKAG